MLILVILYALHLCEVMNNEMFEGILQRPTMFYEFRGVPILLFLLQIKFRNILQLIF